jgi:hypothetical protein
VGGEGEGEGAGGRQRQVVRWAPEKCMCSCVGGRRVLEVR